MIHLKTYFCALSVLIIHTICFANEFGKSGLLSPFSSKDIDDIVVSSTEPLEVFQDSIIVSSEFIAPLQKNDSVTYPPKFKDYRRLGYNSLLYVGAAAVSFGIIWTIPESFTHWDKKAMKENGFFYKWKQNVKAGPVRDGDNFALNYIAHPYCGGVYYMTARSSGFGIFESFSYSVFMSTLFWEFGTEAFAEIPSIQDLIVTPILGSLVGEGFFHIKKSIIRHDKKVLNSKFLGITSLFILDPFNTVLDRFGYKEKIKTHMNIAPVGFDLNSNKKIWGLNFSASF